MSSSASPSDGYGATVTRKALDSPQDHELLSLDAAELKRRRIARACDCCRKKKIKCDGKMPACANCINYKTECVFTYSEKKRNPPKGAKYIESLETRLEKMEDLIRVFLPDYHSDAGDDPAELEQSVLERIRSVVRSDSVAVSKPASTASPVDHPSAQKIDSPHLRSANDVSADPVVETADTADSSFLIKDGEKKFVGHSSVLSLFSPRGLKWISQKLGDTSFEYHMNDIRDNGACEQLGFGDFDATRFIDSNNHVERRTPMALPTREMVEECATTISKVMMTILPIFTVQEMSEITARVYQDTSKVRIIDYCTINTIVALGLRLRTIDLYAFNNQEDQAEPQPTKATADDPSWAYFSNATYYMNEVICGSNSIIAVQTLLMLSLYLEGSDTTEAAYMISANAIRVSQCIGLHYSAFTDGVPDADSLRRQRLFWICYIVDKNMALRSGRPPAIQDEEVLTPEPVPGNESRPDVFHILIRFAKIESKTFRCLYSSAAANISEAEISETIGELDRELLEWRDSIPLEYRPDHEIAEKDPMVLVHYVFIHFGYYNCLTAIHRMSIHHATWRRRRAGPSAPVSSRNPRVFASAALCVQAARSTIYLLKYFDNVEGTCGWMVVYYTLTSLVTLFANTLQNPTQPSVQSDLALMTTALRFVKVVFDLSYHGNAPNRITKFFEELVRVASVVVQRAQESKANKKRPAWSLDVSSGTASPNLAGGLSSIAPEVEAPKASYQSLQQIQLLNQAYQADYSMPSNGMSQYFEPASANGLYSYGRNGAQSLMSSQTLFDPLQIAASSPSLTERVEPPVSMDATPKTIDDVFLDQHSSEPFVPHDMWNLPALLSWDWGVETFATGNDS